MLEGHIIKDGFEVRRVGDSEIWYGNSLKKAEEAAKQLKLRPPKQEVKKNETKRKV